ncbi:MAG: GIY-YIG nuclease family protein [candidate division WOR-3 bacterium]|nr:GIY-YIG nuclease family protein [candidate division WOR-3 bacterium]
MPWELVYYEKNETKKEALRREKEIKSKKNRKNKN